MDSLFTSDFFTNNRRALRQTVAPEIPIVIIANGLLQRTADNTYPFAQESSFWYLTGIDQPDVILVMTANVEYLIVPARSTSREAFDGAVDDEALKSRSGVGTVHDEEEGWAAFAQEFVNAKQIATPAVMPQYIEQYGMYTNPSRARLDDRLLELVPDAELLDIRKELVDLRVIKQAPELAAIEDAIRITSDTLLQLTSPDQFKLYHDEYEIEADLTREFRFRGAAGHAFAPIIAGGKRACTLHNVSNAAPLEPDVLVVLDVGAEIEHYAADITRTRVYGEQSERQQAVFDAVLDVQAYALTLLKPGAMLKEYEEAVAEYMGKALQKLGLITEITHDTVRKYYPHATTHFLGLDVHDVGDYSQPLAPDMVLTCEPGIYIPEEGIGVRIEDDVLITSEGNRVLTADLPRSLA